MVYVNLESIEERDFALNDPKASLDRFPNGAIVDEIQIVPDLLSYIQLRVVENEQMRMFVFTGNHQFALRQGITQSLSRRTALLDLLPLSIGKLNHAEMDFNFDDCIFKGFYREYINII